jgi:hypothetical protein
MGIRKSLSGEIYDTGMYAVDRERDGFVDTKKPLISLRSILCNKGSLRVRHPRSLFMRGGFASLIRASGLG